MSAGLDFASFALSLMVEVTPQRCCSASGRVGRGPLVTPDRHGALGVPTRGKCPEGLLLFLDQ